MKKLNFIITPPHNIFCNKTIKKVIIYSSITLCLFLSACGRTSQSPEDNTSSEISSTELSPEGNISSSESNASPNTQLKDISQYISSVFPNAEITTDENSMNIDLSDCYTSSSTEYVQEVLSACAYILGTSGFENEFSNISFGYNCDKVFMALTITDFKSISDFTSTLFCTGEDANHVTAFNILYDKIFYNHDTKNKQLIAQGDLAKQYGIDGGDSVAERQPEDDLWFYSSFNGSIIHELQESTYVINYRYDTEDTYSYGQSVGNDINNAAKNLRTYLSKSELLSFDKILIICFDGESNNAYSRYSLEKNNNGSWYVGEYEIGDEKFKEGLESVLGN
ncbi:hypothetical protein [Eubacterium sp. An11]|uniref:hypothetical protein n=1 Tax=Eubacterium sp. An11 TaxID=1965542 RepID=UPI001121FDB0|nr:hypothetical protein [Eubacterium sp. An11]